MNVQRLSREGVGGNTPEMVTTFFYTLNCPFSGDIKYVGRTINPRNRMRNHIYEAKKNNKNKRERWIVSLLRKNEEPVMRIMWVGLLTNDDAIRVEKKLISVFRKKFDLKNGDDKGLGGNVSTICVYQYTLDGELIGSFLNANQAYIKTAIKDSNILRCCKNENGYGSKTAGGFFWSFIKYDKYPFKFISEWRSLKGKPVRCVDTGEEFISARKADASTGVNYKHISACCNGKRKTAGGFKWEFIKC